MQNKNIHQRLTVKNDNLLNENRNCKNIHSSMRISTKKKTLHIMTNVSTTSPINVKSNCQQSRLVSQNAFVSKKISKLK